MELVTMKLSELIPYENNPRINDQAVDAVAESIKQCEYVSPIIVDENNVILAGHTRLKALQKLNYTECEVLIKSGLTEEQKKKYRLLDNKTDELSFWDFEKLVEELDGMDFGGFDFGFDLYQETEEDKKQELYDQYSKGVGTVEYKPTGGEHDVQELYSMPTKFDRDIAKIKNVELRKMFQIRACWFCEFDFSKIADYYAGQATAEEQEVMEELALVLLDKDGLIRNGLADLLADVDGLDTDSELLEDLGDAD